MGPEDAARQDIDKMLTDSGWVIQDYETRNLSESLGVAVREYPLSKDNVDYALFIDSQPIGVVEAKKHGHTLSGVVEQSEKYLDGLHEIPSNDKDGRVKFYELFGDDYEKILEELHEVLINQ